jgi:hypothetical protein
MREYLDHAVADMNILSRESQDLFRMGFVEEGQKRRRGEHSALCFSRIWTNTLQGWPTILRTNRETTHLKYVKSKSAEINGVTTRTKSIKSAHPP